VTGLLGELAVRMAVGAARSDVVRLVLRDTATLVLAGLALGAVLAFVLARSLAALLYGVGPLDPVTWTAVPLVLVAVALAAAFGPARRAGRLDPLDGLRER
jgi:ABC-type antimicrobial peptide transport system permease subunit